MIAKQISTRFCLCSATVLLASAGLFAQMPQGGGQQPSQQPSMPGQPSQQPASPGMGTPETNQGTALTAQDYGERAFVTKALEGSQAEVQLGQLAQQKSQSDDVKQFAQKMVTDHTQMNDKWFKPMARQLGVSEPKGPSKKDQKTMAKLEGLSGSQFDTEYIAMMLKDHQKDLKEFNDEAKVAQNPNVRHVAEQGSTVIAQHLQLIEQVAKNHNVSGESKSKQGSSM